MSRKSMEQLISVRQSWNNRFCPNRFDLRICSKKDSTAEFVLGDEFWRKRHSGKKAQAVSQGVVYTGSVKLFTSRTKKRTSTEKFLRRTPGP